MLRLSNGIIAAVNVVMLLVACTALGYSLWLNQRSKSQCEKTLRTPLLVASAALVAVSAAGVIGACCSVSFFMWLYLVMVFALIVGLTAFTIFGVIVTHGRIGGAAADHRSWWLRRQVMNEENWETIRACLERVNLCGGVEGGKSEEYYHLHLSPLQVGCCTPPSSECPRANTSRPMQEVKEPDCAVWSKNTAQRCLRCEKCKAAVLERVRSKWRTLAAINACAVAMVSLVYFISCCAMRNIQKHSYTRK
ncbi:tetraspanin-5-like isoform X2 [Andrographis paniculata]|uniref:tetraspanin-5-like isoform X2 n=1 Tax=Andrographis paniculata TaxID=175694 RepID=UPI0021E8856F|nr:tetraspanin-5-like isoform X2 [Andrographis paniculata]